MDNRNDNAGMYLLLFHLIAIPSICALLLAALTLCGVNIPLLTGEPLEGSREQTFSIKEAIPPGEAERLRSLQEEMLRRSNSEGDDTDSASKTENADSEEQAETLWVYPGSQIIGDDDDAVTFTFAGDLLLDPYYATGSTAQSIGLAACFDDASLSVMRDSDIFVVNNEFPYTDSNVPQENKQFTFHAPPSAAAMLNDIGADLALLANNHMYDYKAIGVTDTVNALDAAGIPHIGAGRNIAEASRPQVYTIHSENAEPFTVAIINATQVEQYATPNTLPATESDPGVFRCFDPALLYSTIEQTKAAVDFVIVTVHWGTEKEEEIQYLQADQAQGMVAHGADLIIGGHPHILQPIEYVNGVPVVYSLGNYLFTSYLLDTGVVRITLQPSTRSLASLQFIPMLQDNCHVRTADGAEKDRILQYVQNMSRGIVIDEEGFVRPAQ